MSLLQLFGKKEKPQLREIVETQVPQYKDTLPDHTNRTVPIMETLRRDPNQTPYAIFSEASLNRPKYAISAQLTKPVEGSKNPTILLIGGMSFTPEDRVLVNTTAGELEGETVYTINGGTLDALLGYTKEFIEAQQVAELAERRKDHLEQSNTESEPKSNF